MTTKVQANCIKVAVRAGKIELAAKLALMANLESCNQVYLDNAKQDCESAGMTAAQFAGGLSALTTKGVYRPTGAGFGEYLAA